MKGNLQKVKKKCDSKILPLTPFRISLLAGKERNRIGCPTEARNGGKLFRENSFSQIENLFFSDPRNPAAVLSLSENHFQHRAILLPERKAYSTLMVQ
jgi:hypothetical protein